MRMYLRYAERKNWKHEILDINENELGGIKTAILRINGKGVYRRLKYESGVHRVQEFRKLKLQEEYIPLQLQLLCFLNQQT